MDCLLFSRSHLLRVRLRRLLELRHLASDASFGRPETTQPLVPEWIAERPSGRRNGRPRVLVSLSPHPRPPEPLSASAVLPQQDDTPVARGYSMKLFGRQVRNIDCCPFPINRRAI